MLQQNVLNNDCKELWQVPEHRILSCLAHLQVVPKRDAGVGSEDTMVRRT